MSLALELVDIRKRFGATVALDGASLRVQHGSVHAVLGENGAGKTTLVRMAVGELRPDSGVVCLDGTTVDLTGPRDAIGRGVGMVHQHFALVPAMTVVENVALGMSGRYDLTETANRVRALAAQTGLQVSPSARIRDLPVPAQQRVEILRALARSARLLVLDEPTAVLAPAEADELLSWLRRFADTGGSVVLITHKLREARAVADELTVLREGRTVATYAPSEVTDAILVSDMVGQEVGDSWNLAGPELGPVVLHLEHVVVPSRETGGGLRDVTLAVRAGELLGIAAVEGAGQHELLRVLAGRIHPAGGTSSLPAHIAFIPEDRHRDAMVLEFSLLENVALRDLGSRGGLMPWKTLRRHTEALLATFDVRAPSPAAPASSLSGGNQQKLVIARELVPRPDAIVAENPTRGLDVRATLAVRRHLRNASDSGVAVVMYSTDIDEVLALADRIAVVYAGRVHEVPRDREAIGRAMVGLAS